MRRADAASRMPTVVPAGFAGAVVLLCSLIALPVGAASQSPPRHRRPPTTTSTTTTPVTTPNASPPTVIPAGQLVFSDEFDGTTLDLSKWQPNWLGASNASVTKPINSAELSCYDPAQVSESGGYLSLTAAARPCTAANGVTYKYASGLVESRPVISRSPTVASKRACAPCGAGRHHRELARVLGRRNGNVAGDRRARRDGRSLRIQRPATSTRRRAVRECALRLRSRARGVTRMPQIGRRAR